MLPERFQKSLAALRPSPTVVAAISGGGDSMALLELLASQTSHKIIVAHFNHQLRSAESDRDEQFVREQAARRELKFHSDHGDVRKTAKGISIEMAARKLRHEFLARLATRHNADVVLAHHADDQIELFLMRVERGIDGPGLAGMRPISPSPANPKIRLLRPLLKFRRDELAALAVPYREDSSNAELQADRNRVRHLLIPALRKSHGPTFDKTILRQISKTQTLADRLRTAANAWLKAPSNFSTLPDFLQREIIATQLDRAKIQITADLLQKLLSPHQRISSSSDQSVCVGADGRLQIFNELWPTNSSALSISRPGHTEFESLELSWSNPAKPELSPNPHRLVFDADRVGSRIHLRHWRPGDRIRLSGRASTRPLHEMLSRNKIARDQRHRLILATTDSGAIFWVEGLRITEDFKVTLATRRFLEWRWERRVL